MLVHFHVSDKIIIVMRTSKTTNNLKVNAIAGTYLVTLGFNLPEGECSGLLRFSILRKRSEVVKNWTTFAEETKVEPNLKKAIKSTLITF